MYEAKGCFGVIAKHRTSSNHTVSQLDMHMKQQQAVNLCPLLVGMTVLWWTEVFADTRKKQITTILPDNSLSTTNQ